MADHEVPNLFTDPLWTGGDRRVVRLHPPGHSHLPGSPVTFEADQKWRVVIPSTLAGKPVPECQWVIPNWLPKRLLTLLEADARTDKTLLALQIQATLALGGHFLGIKVEQCSSIGLYSEDETDELHFHLNGIRESYLCGWSDLDKMTMVPGAGQDNLLAVWNGTRIVPTLRFAQLRQHALKIGARAVVIDSGATTFGGSEIDRAQVTQFCTLLTGLAQDIDGAVLLLALPSAAGSNVGSAEMEAVNRLKSETETFSV